MTTSNSFNNAVKVLERAADCIENNLGLARAVSNEYDEYFKADGAKHGDTIHLRVPALGYKIRTGPAADPQGYTDTLIPLTLTQYGADMSFTSSQLRLNLEDGDAFMQNVLNPLLAPVSNQLDKILWDLVPGISSSVGTPASKPTNMDLVFDGDALLKLNGCPDDGNKTAVFHPRHQAGMLKGATSYFNPSSDISKQFQEGRLARLIAGYKCDYDQNAISHTVGTIGTSTPVMNGSTADGASQIVTSGWASSAAAVAVGDQISIAGVYAVNPVSKASTGELKLFAVTAIASSAGAAMTIKITPSIVLTGPNQNVNAVPVTTAAVYVWGANAATHSAKVSATSLLLHKDCLALACVDLGVPDGGGVVFAKRMRTKNLGIPIRLVQWYNGNADATLYRLDILAGAALKRENFGCRIIG